MAMYTREVNDYDAVDLSRKRSLLMGLPMAERHTVAMATGSEILYEMELSWNEVQSSSQG
jgi:hypothetical protein